MENEERKDRQIDQSGPKKLKINSSLRDSRSQNKTQFCHEIEMPFTMINIKNRTSSCS